jgi:DinB superfamily
MKKITIVFFLLAGLTAGAQQKPAPPSNLRDVLLEQFRDTWVDQDWFVPVMKSLDGVTAKQAMWKAADSAHSIGELAYHIWFWNKEQLDKFNGVKPAAFSGNNNETFTAFTTEAWEKVITQLNDVMKAWETAIKTADDAKLRAWASALDHINTHTAYHTGQIMYVRKLQGVWDSNKGVK